MTTATMVDMVAVVTSFEAIGFTMGEAGAVNGLYLAANAPTVVEDDNSFTLEWRQILVQMSMSLSIHS